MSYEAYRSYQTKSGESFQEYVKEVFEREINVELNMCKTKEEQYNIGENLEGYEIKYDKVMSRTGNLYIETHEKARPRKGAYVESGISRNDNTKYYVIGNKKLFYVFEKEELLRLRKAGAGTMFREVQKPTSLGFLLPTPFAEAYNYMKFIDGKKQ